MRGARMHGWARVATLAGVVAALVCVAPACPVAGACAADGDCAAGAVCVAGGCLEAGAGAPVIARVDGDGSARPVLADLDALALDDPRPAARRVQRALVVEGAGFAAVTGAYLDDGAAPLSLGVADISEDGDTMTLTLPAGLRAGLFTLVVVTATHAARAQVFVLQGEPGLASLLEPRDASPEECPAGGVRWAAGLDADADGALDPAEEDAAKARVVCNGLPGADGADGDSALVCDEAGCALDRELVVQGRPVLTHVDAPVTVRVPQDAPTISAALALFDGVRLDGNVTVLVTGTSHVEPGPVRVRHPDAARLRVEGELPAAATVVTFIDTNGFVVAGQRFGGIANLTVQGNGNAGTAAVFVDNGGFMAIGAGSVLAGFGNGVHVRSQGVVVADGVAARNTVNGFFAVVGGYLRAAGASVTASENGFVAQVGAVVDAPNAGANVTGMGGIVGQSSFGNFAGASLTGGTFGLNVFDTSAAQLTNGGAAGGTVGLTASFNSTVRCGPCGTSSTSFDPTSVFLP